MSKNFDIWNHHKKDLHKRERIVFFNEREVWWCSIGLNIGSEQDGGKFFERPVLIVKKFNRDTFWALPLTTSKALNNLFFHLSDRDSISVSLTQLRLTSSKRLERFMYKVNKEEFIGIIVRIKELFPKE